jgi:uncharacterized protein (DUF433 family)/DNA-binding transcriptional MerR regulator
MLFASGNSDATYHNVESTGNMTQNDKVLAAFSVEHAARVTGLSMSRLTRWDKEGFFSPEYADEEDRGNPYSRVYSFIDLVGLRTLALLTDRYQISLAELRKTYPELAKRVKRPWSDAQLAVWKRKVIWDLIDLPRDRHGQYLGNHIELPSIASEVAERSEELRNRGAGKVGLIERHRFVAHNAPVVAGTRIPAKAIASFIEDGFDDDTIIEEYPSITKLDIAAVRNSMRDAA